MLVSMKESYTKLSYPGLDSICTIKSHDTYDNVEQRQADCLTIRSNYINQSLYTIQQCVMQATLQTMFQMIPSK